MDNLKTNSKLDVLLKRNPVTNDVGNTDASKGPVTDPKDCDWNKVSRLEQTKKWLSNESDTRSKCPVASTDPKHPHCANCQFNGKNPNHSSPYIGGIDFPDGTSPGTGNIVISAKYGHGKTTLALQLASACAEQGHIALYVSLQDQTNTVLDNYANRAFISSIATAAIGSPLAVTQHTLASRIHAAQPPKTCPPAKSCPLNQLAKNLIFVSLNTDAADLSSDDINREAKKIKEGYRGEVPEGADAECILYFSQLDSVLTEIESSTDTKKVKLIVVDSLTQAVGPRYSRHLVHHLMRRLKKNNIIGVFPLEDRSAEGDIATRFINDVKYTADCILNLTTSKHGDYEQACIEVEKNRTAKHVLGKHIYKIAEFPESERHIHLANRRLNILPSLHYVFTTLPAPDPIDRVSTQVNLLGDPVFKEILPQSLTGAKFQSKARTAQILTLAGVSGLYKSDIAINSLLYGLLDGQNGLIIRLNDNETFTENGVRLNEDLWAAFGGKRATLPATSTGYIEFEEDDAPGGSKSVLAKYDLTCWKVKNVDKTTLLAKTKDKKAKDKKAGEKDDPVRLFEIVFKKGAIQPEEWLSLLVEVIDKEKIKRAALVDLRFIGVSYKFLVSNETSGDMLLPTFTQAMKSRGVDLIYAASDCGIGASQQETLRVRNLANATVVFDQESGVKLSGTFDVIRNQSHSIQLKHNDEGKIKVRYHLATLQGNTLYGEIDHNLPTFSIG